MFRFFALLVFLPAFAFAATQPIIAVHKMGPGRQLQLALSQADAGKPTFLFLPGVNRSLLLSEPAAQELIKDGFGVAAFNFSVQPISIATLKAGEKPAFYDKEVTLESLAEETLSVAKALQRQYGIKNLIPVTLSYSGAVSLSLKGFPLVIDSVPLTSVAAFSPELEMYRNWLKAGEILNPIFGPSITRASLDQAYRFQWESQVNSISAQFQLPAERHDEMVDGYIRLSRATESFEWSNKGDRTHRVFLLAARENPALLHSQVDMVRERLGKGSGESVYIVQESGHIMPADQPLVYANILEAVAEGKNQAGLTMVKPSSGEWKSLSVQEALPFLENAVKDLPGAPSGTSSSVPRGGVPGTL